MVHKAPLWHPLSRRLHLLFLIMFGLFNATNINTNIAITVTCMINYTAVALEQESSSNISIISSPLSVTADTPVVDDHHCGQVIQTEGAAKPVLDYGGSLIWNGDIQNWIFSASFWGGVAAVIPSILFVQKLHPKWCFAAALTIKTAMASLIPLLAVHTGFKGVFVARFITGMTDPFLYPSINAIVANWFPIEERSTAVALFTAGNQLSMFVGNPVAASLCKSSLGWPAVYYISACSCGVAIILWIFTASLRPPDCKRMTKIERQYLMENTVSRAGAAKKKPIPWLKIFTNPAFLSHLFATYALGVSATFMMTYLPTYFKDVLFLGVLANGTFTSIPMLCNLCFKLSWGVIVDKLKQKKILTPTWAVKVSQCFPTFGVAFPLIGIIFLVNCSRPFVALLLVCIANMFMGGHTSGGYTQLLSLAPVFTPTLSSISVSLTLISQLATPFIVGLIRNDGTTGEWNVVLALIVIISIVSGIQFLIWGSAEVQPFAKTDEPESLPMKSIPIIQEPEEDENLLRALRVEMRSSTISLM